MPSLPSKKLLKNRNQTFSIVRYFTRKIELVSNILSMIVSETFFWFYLPQTPSTYLFENFGNHKAFYNVLTKN